MKCYKQDRKIIVSDIGIWKSRLEYDIETNTVNIEIFNGSLEDFFNLYCSKPEKHEQDFEYKKAYIEILNKTKE